MIAALLNGVAWRGLDIPLDPPSTGFDVARLMSPREVLEDGARRYRAHAARQTAEGLYSHAASSLLKAEHKERQAQRLRAFFV